MPLVVPRQEFARIALIIVVIFFLYISPDTPNSTAKSSQISFINHASQSNEFLNILNSSQWQDFAPRSSLQQNQSVEGKYVNLTGFRESDGYRGWERFNTWKERCVLFHQEANRRSDINEIQGNIFYANTTGVLRGKWVRYEADITGLEKRVWSKMNLSEIAPSSRWNTEKNEDWKRNITGSSGSIKLRIDEKESEDLDVESIKTKDLSIEQVRKVTATINLHDESNKGNGWLIRIYGVHWPKKGVLLMTTTSEKFAGIFGLPHLTHSFEQFTSSKQCIDQTLGMALQNLEKNPKKDYGNPLSSFSENEAAHLTPQCEFVVFAQVYPIELDKTSRISQKKAELVNKIEDELRFPKGIPLPKIPRLQISTVILSPDCGFILESEGPPDFAAEDGEHLIGEKQEVIFKNIHQLLELFAVLILGQTFLLKAQSKHASTPSTVGCVSLYTISMMLFADAFIFASLSLLSGTSPNFFPSALLASFMSLMSVMLGIRFISAIWNSQEPERRERTRQRQATEALTHPLPSEVQADSHTNITDVNSVINPGIIVNIPENNPIIIPSDQDIDAEIFENGLNSNSSILPTTNPNAGSTQTRSQSNGVSFATMYIRSVLLLTLVLFLTLTSASWPIQIRAIYIYTLSLAYLSFPAFQIYRNIQRNCRKALLWKFVVGQSVLRLTPFAYFYLKKDNILFSETDSKAFFLLAGWLWIQCWVLVAQNILGPRWGLPKTWYIEGWNYHPILHMESLEAKGLPIGLVSNQDPLSPVNSLNAVLSPISTEQGKKGKKNVRLRSVDCAICMQILEVPILETGKDTTTGGVIGILESRRYMVTPCRHIFHSTCLEGWMRFRLQCPICRENLPPL